jgi:hypothetical protein
VIAGILSKPHPFEDGAFGLSLLSLPFHPSLISNSVCGLLSREGKVKSRGLTTLLWISLIFGICGELWLIFGFYGLDFALLPWIFGVSVIPKPVF